MSCRVDHLVVAAASLEQGDDWCRRMLGVAPQPGGCHALMGTHNRLLKLGGTAYPDAYLEIIAIDPAAPPPGRVRWFGLDDPALQSRIAREPALIHLCARCDDLAAMRLALQRAGSDPGNVVHASRKTAAGLLAWQMLLRDDGRLQAGGAMPTLLQWSGSHPARALADSGVALESVRLGAVPARWREGLTLAGVDWDAASAIEVVLRTPAGRVTLGS